MIKIIKKYILKNCRFCYKGGNIQKERIGGNMYGRVYYFHNKCLTDILTHPENYTHSQVDMVLEIEEGINEREKQEKKDRDNRTKKIILAQNRRVNGPTNTGII